MRAYCDDGTCKYHHSSVSNYTMTTTPYDAHISIKENKQRPAFVRRPRSERGNCRLHLAFHKGVENGKATFFNASSNPAYPSKTIIAQELHHRHCAFEQAGKLPPSHVRLAISSIAESGGKSDCFHMTGFIENKNFWKIETILGGTEPKLRHLRHSIKLHSLV